MRYLKVPCKCHVSVGAPHIQARCIPTNTSMIVVWEQHWCHCSPEVATGIHIRCQQTTYLLSPWTWGRPKHSSVTVLTHFTHSYSLIILIYSPTVIEILSSLCHWKTSLVQVTRFCASRVLNLNSNVPVHIGWNKPASILIQRSSVESTTGDKCFFKQGTICFL